MSLSSPLDRVLHETEFHRFVDHGAFLELVRTEVPYPTVDALENEYRALVAAKRPMENGSRGLLVDLRRARGRNDPEFEAAIGRWRRRSLVGFQPLIVLVQSALGVMHVERHMRTDGLEAQVTTNESTARSAFRPSHVRPID